MGKSVGRKVRSQSWPAYVVDGNVMQPQARTATPPPPFTPPSLLPPIRVTYCEVVDGNVLQPQARTAVHRRKVGNYY